MTQLRPMGVTRAAYHAKRAERDMKQSERMEKLREKAAEKKAAKAANRAAAAQSYQLTREEFATYQGTIQAIIAKMGTIDKVAQALRVGNRVLRDRLKKIYCVRKEHLLAATALRTLVKA